MIVVKYSEAIDHLLRSSTEIRRFYDARAREFYAFDNPHVVYGSILVEYVNSLMGELDARSRGSLDGRLKNIFGLIEELALSPDFAVRCLIETGFLEGLLREEGDLDRFSPHMGPATKALAREVVRK